ncbi:MAG: hypothetical protein OHK0028_03320 [Deltaproteobacteria bacterium]
MRKSLGSIPISKGGLAESQTVHPCYGRLVGKNPEGNVLVEIDGLGRRVARSIEGLDPNGLSRENNIGREVLLLFAGGDPDQPVIVGLMAESGGGARAAAPGLVPGDGVLPEEARIDGRRLVIEGHEEVVLKCGKGSITVRADGKVVIRGTNLLSWSSGTNRIKGGSVSIN